MITWGINALNHDASIAVFDNHDLISHKRSYEFSGIIGDSELSQDLIDHALRFGIPEKIYWYERPWLKKSRQLYAGQYNRVFDLKDLPKNYMKKYLPTDIGIHYTQHHHSHAAAGYFTSDFNHAAVVVIDAIGEWESQSIWLGKDNKLSKLWSKKYPHSLGLFYSAFTKLIGLKPTVEEYLLQQKSLEGNSDRYYTNISGYLKQNLHKGVKNWPYKIDYQAGLDISAGVQRIFEEQVNQTMCLALELTKSNNLVYMGGCAMNSKYNERLPNLWKGIWSLPWPGDASSAVGARLAHTRQRLVYKFNIVKHLKVTI